MEKYHRIHQLHYINDLNMLEDRTSHQEKMSRILTSIHCATTTYMERQLSTLTSNELKSLSCNTYITFIRNSTLLTLDCKQHYIHLLQGKFASALAAYEVQLTRQSLIELSYQIAAGSFPGGVLIKNHLHYLS